MENKNLINLILLSITAILLISCLTEDKLKLPFSTYEPMELNDGWKLSSPEKEGIDQKELDLIYRYVHENKDLWQIRSLLIFRNGQLVAESYTKNRQDATQPRAVWSCTKQIIGILTGIAIEKGYIKDTHSTIGEYLPEWTMQYPDKQNITIDNLLKMKSGIDFENDGAKGQSAMLLRQIPSSSLDFILSLPYRASQGELFNYNDGDPQLLSAILQKQTQKSTALWASEILLSPLGIKNWDWICYKDGITLGAFGILTTPRELSKIGQLVLNNGQWGNQQIVNRQWICKMTTPKVTAGETAIDKPFGYYWWLDPNRDMLFMYGHGGQYVFINRAKKLMVTITAEPNTQGKHSLMPDKAIAIYDRIVEITF